MAESESNHVGPIVFSHAIPREQLQDVGDVITFRKSDRTTGETWWRKSRTGEKEGDCRVSCVVEDVDPQDTQLLEKYQPLSGFTSVEKWRDAIKELNGGLPDNGYLYRVTRPPAQGFGGDTAQSISNSGNSLEDAPARSDDGTLFFHSTCGTQLRVSNAVLENGQTWCPDCSMWFEASPETVNIEHLFDLDVVEYYEEHDEGHRGRIPAEEMNHESAKSYHRVELIDPEHSVSVGMKWSCGHCGKIYSDPKVFENETCLAWAKR
jgi:hypothetical protein